MQQLAAAAPPAPTEKRTIKLPHYFSFFRFCKKIGQGGFLIHRILSFLY